MKKLLLGSAFLFACSVLSVNFASCSKKSGCPATEQFEKKKHKKKSMRQKKKGTRLFKKNSR